MFRFAPSLRKTDTLQCSVFLVAVLQGDIASCVLRKSELKCKINECWRSSWLPGRALGASLVTGPEVPNKMS